MKPPLSDYIGIRYEHLGRGLNLDCYGLVMKFYQEQFDISLPDFHYQAKPDEQHAAFFAGIPLWIPTSSPMFGDVVHLRPHHCGIAVDRNRMLHVMADGPSRLERLDSAAWRRRIEGFYYHPARGGR